MWAGYFFKVIESKVKVTDKIIQIFDFFLLNAKKGKEYS